MLQLFDYIEYGCGGGLLFQSTHKVSTTPNHEISCAAYF